MASPFQIFRKHEKIIIVVAGVLLLVAWLLGDALMNMAMSISGRSSEGKEVVATYNGGDITRSDLADLVTKRTILTNVLRQAYQLGYSQLIASNPDGDVPPISVIPVLPFHLEGEQNIEEAAIQNEILWEAAKEEGISIGDEAVKKYLDEVGFHSVNGGQYMKMLSNINFHGRPISDKFLINELRKVLMASAYLKTKTGVLGGPLPEQLWSDWLKFNDSIKLEVAAFPTKDYLAEVKEPSTAEVSKLFEEYKETEPVRMTYYHSILPPQNPGFRVPRKAKVKYLIIGHDKIRESIAAIITDEEVEKYYEDNKALEFIKPDDIGVQPIDETPSTTPEDTTPESAGPEEATPSTEATTPETTDTKPAETDSTTPEEPKPEPTETPAEKTDTSDAGTGEEPTPEPPATPEEPATETAPTETAPAEPASPAPEAAPENESAIHSATPFRLVAFQEDEGSAEAPATTTDKVEAAVVEEPKDEPSVAEETATEKAPESAPNEETETEPTESAEPIKETPATEEAMEPASEATGTKPNTETPAPTPAPVIEYRPLEEVAEEIRDRIASERVIERQNEIAKEIFKRLKEPADAYQQRRCNCPKIKLLLFLRQNIILKQSPKNLIWN